MSEKYWIINGQGVSDYHVLGYTEYSSSPCRIWNSGGNLVVNAWRASEDEPDIPLYYWLGDNGSGQPVNRWFEDEAALENEGYSLTPPLIGYIYGVMDATEDKDRDVIETGLTGHMELIHGSLLDCSIGEYGVIKQALSTTITFGVTTVVPANVVAMDSKYWWMYGFSGGSSLRNLWTPSAWSTSLLNNSAEEWMQNAEFEEASFWDGINVEDFDSNQWKLKLKTYNGRPEMYTDQNSAINTPSNCGIIIVPGSNPAWTNRTQFVIPRDCYSISGTMITWNASHPLYNLLRYNNVTVYYTL